MTFHIHSRSCLELLYMCFYVCNFLYIQNILYTCVYTVFLYYYVQVSEYTLLIQKAVNWLAGKAKTFVFSYIWFVWHVWNQHCLLWCSIITFPHRLKVKEGFMPCKNVYMFRLWHLHFMSNYFIPILNKHGSITEWDYNLVVSVCLLFHWPVKGWSPLYPLHIEVLHLVFMFQGVNVESVIISAFQIWYW